MKRITAIYIILTLMMSLCIVSLYKVSTGTKAKTALAGQYLRGIEVAARRGIIYDRNGSSLNAVSQGYRCIVNPDLVKDKRDLCRRLSEVSERKESELVELFLQEKPFIINVTDSSSIQDTEGLFVFPIYKKSHRIAPHLIGYTDGDGNGAAGLERGFDEYLSSVLGGYVHYSYCADAIGRTLENSGSILTDKGYSEYSGIRLTIDKSLQKLCETVSREKAESGAVTVSEIESGDILASVSLPWFDAERTAEYLDSDKGELINRCAASFTPGSIFKTVVAAASLEKDADSFNREYTCHGYYELSSGVQFSCHQKSGHGKIGMKEAYAQSCNVYFISLALDTGAAGILKAACDMGLFRRRTLDGNLTFGKELHLPESIDEGLIANIAIGQGPLLISPYEASIMFSCAASGYRTEPRILLEIFRGNSTLRESSVNRERVLSRETSERLRECMLECVENGLGKSARPSEGNAGGKTATAQTGSIKDGKRALNTWFCGIYPIDEPKYAITVLCDNSSNGEGARDIFREICEYLKENG